MKFGTVVVRSKCKQPIVSGQDFGYVCFKIPGKEGYHFFRVENLERHSSNGEGAFEDASSDTSMLGAID